jgi:hypothetical protein
MKPIQFKEQNVTYTAEGCNDLPAHKAADQIISCWKLTKEELEQINKTGVIWFSVMGQSQPPIWLGTENPFKEEEVREMITEKQKDYILDLYKEIGMEPEEDLDNLTKQQASNLIEELKQIKEEIS